MNPVDDETLMAYSDGVLGAGERRKVEAQLERDPEARRFVADLEHSANVLRRAFERPALEPPPSHLVQQVMAPTPQLTSLSRRRSRTRKLWAPFAVAASAVLAVVWLTVGIPRDGEQGAAPFAVARGPLENDSQLIAVLERFASGEPRSVGELSRGVRATPMLTFRDSLQRPCRELEVTQASGTITDLIIACRESGAHWIVEGVFRMASSGEASSDYQPAGGVDGQADPTEALLSRIGASEPVPPSEERRLLDSGWK